MSEVFDITFVFQNTCDFALQFRSWDIDLIIADLKLPYINGLEMISLFRDSGYKGEAILISAYPDLITSEELERLSIGHFFVKPLDLKALNQSIDHLLNGKNHKSKRMKGQTSCQME